MKHMFPIEVYTNTDETCTECGSAPGVACTSDAPVCTHDSRTAHRAFGDVLALFWECDECGNLDRMTPAEVDWTRTDVPKCASCGYSEEFGPLAIHATTFGGEVLRHEGSCPTGGTR